MKIVNLTDLIPDRRNEQIGYLARTIATSLNLSIGDVFGIDCGEEQFKIVGESVYREDIHKDFDGFTCRMQF